MTERIDSIFDIPSIQAEYEKYSSFINQSQKALTDLYSTTKQFKDSNIGNVAENTQKLSMAMTGVADASKKATQANKELVESVKAVATGVNAITKTPVTDTKTDQPDEKAFSFPDLQGKIAEQTAAIRENIETLHQDTTAFDGLIQQAVKNKLANDELRQSALELKKVYDQGSISLEQYQSSLESITAAQASLKANNAENTKALSDLDKQARASAASVDELGNKIGNNKTKTDEEIKAQIDSRQATRDRTKEIIAQSDAYKALDLQYQKAAANAKTLQAIAVQARDKATVTGSPEDQDAAAKATSAAQAASQAANTINNRLKTIDSSVGESRRKVGDYTGALKILEGALFEVNAKMNTLAESGQKDGAQYGKLSEEAGLLNTLLGQQERGFTSVTMEIRNAERALQTLRAEGFGASEAFNQLRESTTLAAREQKEFQRQQKLLESEAPALQALTIAARALGGAYAIGAGASALFADGNEKVEKEINKLVAIMTILQGLEEANRLINEGGAIAKALQTAETGLLTAATEAYTIATGEATLATDSFTASFIASGIGAVIIAVAVGIGLLISKLVELAGADERAVKTQKELAEATKELNDIFQKEIDIIGKVNQDAIEKLKEQLDASKALGITKEQEFAIKKKIADLDADQAKKAFDSATKLAQAEQESAQFEAFQLEKKIELADLDRQLKRGAIDIADFTTRAAQINSRNIDHTITAENALAASRDFHAAKYADELRKLQDLQETAIINEQQGKEIPDALKHKIEAVKAQMDLDKDAEDKAEALIKKRGETETAAQVAENDIVKAGEDMRRKIKLENIKLDAEMTKAANEQVLGDERSTLDQRLSALKSNAAQEIRILQAQHAAMESDPTISNDEKKQDAIKTADDIKKTNLKSAEDERKVVLDAARKTQEEKLEILKIEIQDQISSDEEIINSENSVGQKVKTSLDKQLLALADYYSKKKELLNADLQYQLSAPELQGADSPEKQQKRLLIFAQYEANLNSLQDDFGKKRVAIEKLTQEQILKEWDLFYQKRKLQISQAAADEFKAINDAEANHKISREKAADERQAVEDKQRTANLQSEVQNDFLIMMSYKDGTAERIKAEQKLTDDAKALGDQRVKNVEDEEDRKKKATLRTLEDIKQVTENVTKAVGNFLDIGFNTQKTNLENLQTSQDKAYEQNVKNIQNSTLAEQDKANKLIILDKQHQAQAEANARKQKELDVEKARFDKAASVLSIIVNTAAAVVKALPNIPLAISIGILGASELAVAVATPLPTYKTGTEDHPRDSYAKVHPGEMIIEPGKAPRMTPPTPESIIYLKKHTKIIPKEEVERLNRIGTQRMFVDKAGQLRQSSMVDHANEEIRGLRRDMQQHFEYHTYALSKAYSKNRPVVNVYNRDMNGWRTRIDQQVRGK